MEENKDDIIYDLESAESAEEQRTQSPDNAVTSDSSDSSENSDNSDSSENSDNSDSSENSDSSDTSENSDDPDPAKAEIERMVEEMGAETLLDIIRDNRNAAIRQIIREVEASRDMTLPSGSSSAKACASIFDLAALA